tara:strand:+ start:5802 stop:6068 length:267 start_codon:yes stop_codon:yes gene_type:complete
LQQRFPRRGGGESRDGGSENARLRAKRTNRVLGQQQNLSALSFLAAFDGYAYQNSERNLRPKRRRFERDIATIAGDSLGSIVSLPKIE